MLSSFWRDIIPHLALLGDKWNQLSLEWEILGWLGGLVLLLIRWNLGFEKSLNGGKEVFLGQAVGFGVVALGRTGWGWNGTSRRRDANITCGVITVNSAENINEMCEKKGREIMQEQNDVGVVFGCFAVLSQIKGLLCSVFLKCRDSPKHRAKLNSCFESFADTFNKPRHLYVPKAGAVWAAGICPRVSSGEF